MTMRERIAARIHALHGHDEPSADVASSFARGDFDDILGKPNPTVDDVRELARAKINRDAFVGWETDKVFCVWHDRESMELGCSCYVTAPTVESAYRALLALPNKVTP